MIHSRRDEIETRRNVLKWLGISIAAGVPTFALMLWLIGFRPTAGQVEASIEIDRINLQVWPWVARAEFQKQWIAGLLEVRETAPRRVVWVMATGAHSRVEIQGEITALTMPVELKMNVRSPGAFSGVSEFRVVELAGGRTKVEMLGDYRYDSWFMRLFEPLLTPRAVDKAKEDLRRLKQKIESNP